jgi:4a-hydroxytetrahydrobiopterin dehydratase
MQELSEMACVPCRAGVPPLSEIEIQELRPLLPAWELVEREGVQRLERVFPFKDFAQALGFTNEVGGIAEAENHHPAILTEYGKVTVTWWTHAVKGLHRNDFIMAARTEKEYTQANDTKTV